MATNNNLTDFLTAVADAIREKNGTTDAINPQDMPGMIASIGGTAVDFTTADNSDTNVSALCTSIANAIRAKKNYDSTKLINPQDFPEEIRGIVTRSYMTITVSSETVVKVDGTKITIPVDTATELEPTTSFEFFFSRTYEAGTYVTDMDLSHLDTSSFTSMYRMFYYCKNFTSFELSSFNTSKVTNMKDMFSECNSLTSLDLSSFNTSSVTNMYAMFYRCFALTTLDVSSFDLSAITTFDQYVFYGCQSLTDIKFGPGWGKANITLTLSYCGQFNKYILSTATFNSMLTMYDRATAGLTNMTIKVKNTTNAPENWTANMQARGYTITVG